MKNRPLVTHRDLMDFARTLGPDEYANRLNYFRIMEYPLALNMLALEPGLDVLEVGAGFISLPPVWMAARERCNVTAVDRKPLTTEAIEYVNGLLARTDTPVERLKLVSADAQKLPLADDSFDRIVAISALEHLDPFTDAHVMRELGRVLKPGGLLVFSVPFNLGRHVELETWGGEEYEQRHYTDATLRERMIHPSGLHFVQGVAFGEIDPQVGFDYIKGDAEERRRLTEMAGVQPDRYWSEHYRIENEEQFVVHRDSLHPGVVNACGLIAVKLQKRDQPLPTSYFLYDPVKNWFANDELTRNEKNSPYWLTIDRVRVENFLEALADTFDSGEFMRVVIDFTCHGEVVDPAFRILIHDQSDEIVAGLHLARSDLKLGTLTGNHRLAVRFGMLNLARGTYYITVGAWDRDRPDPIPPVPYDLHYKRYKIDVHEHKKGMAGVAYLPYDIQWTKPKENE
ncbi:MAG TPA: methyltransferase domain-containing protein [bacterium]|nr:methyltransferase domain-containing protein [bacterium]